MGIRSSANIKLVGRSRGTMLPDDNSTEEKKLPVGKFDFSFLTNLKKNPLDENLHKNYEMSYSSKEFRSYMKRFAEINQKKITPGNKEEYIAPSIEGGVFKFNDGKKDQTIQLLFLDWYDRGFEPRLYMLDGPRFNECGYTDFVDGSYAEKEVRLIGFTHKSCDLLKEVMRQIYDKKGNIKL